MKTNTLCKTCLSLIALALSLNSYAQDNYVGINYGSIDFEEAGDSLDLDTINFTIGSNLNEHIAGELRGGVGISNEDEAGVSIGIDSLIGAYGRINLPNSSPVTPYVVAGVTQVKLEVDFLGLGSATADETDASYGLGADFNVSDNTKLNLEYMKYLDKDGAEIAGLNVGIAVKF